MTCAEILLFAAAKWQFIHRSRKILHYILPLQSPIDLSALDLTQVISIGFFSSYPGAEILERTLLLYLIAIVFRFWGSKGSNHVA